MAFTGVSAMARQVREALQPLTNSHLVATTGNFPGSGASSGYGRDSLQLPTCYRCGQKGHVRRGCRNPPIGSNSFEQLGNGNGPLTQGSQRQPHPVLDTLIGHANVCRLPEWSSLPCVVGHWKSGEVTIRTILPEIPFRSTNATL